MPGASSDSGDSQTVRSTPAIKGLPAGGPTTSGGDQQGWHTSARRSQSSGRGHLAVLRNPLFIHLNTGLEQEEGSGKDP